MVKKKKSKIRNDQQSPPLPIRSRANILVGKNRGTTIDVLIFLANLFLMGFLVRLFLEVFRRAAAGDVIAKSGLLLFYLGMLVLPSVGAVLKRWHFHQRLKLAGENEDDGGYLPFGCMFLPFVYLIVNMWITLAVALTFMDLFPDSEFVKTVSLPLLLFGIVYNIFQTVLVFRFFSRPKHPPKSEFLRDPRSDALGDICIFLNMIFSQVLLNWGALSYPGFREGRFVDRFVPLLVFALLMYLTGRIFFLVEDFRRPRTWLTILLANSVIIVRVVFGLGANVSTK
jgi:hypothetical protein